MKARNTFCKDNEHPYVQENLSTGFVATKLVVKVYYGRTTQRWSKFDFMGQAEMVMR